jgi:O-antigen/teichoic acid export membrane protein
LVWHGCGWCVFMANRLTRWLVAQRSSPRLAFLLQIGCRVLTSVFSLLWIPLLLGSMGKALNGLLLNFQSITSMGGLGDLGMGGLVNIQTSRLLGQGKEVELRKFLAAARGFFGIMALVAGGVFLAIAAGLLHWQKFDTVPNVGPLGSLYVVGAMAIVLLILGSYITNLNYGCGNVVWPVIPAFVIMQLGFLGHWLLARKGAALSVQYLPYLAGSLLIFLLGWVWIRASHPALGVVRPLTVDRKQFITLVAKSFWVYLYALSSSVYTTISTLLITARFGPELLVSFRYNNRLCELAFFVVNSACLASLPKITQWLASPEVGTRERAVWQAERLNKFQTLMGCSAALVYLAANDWFIRLWLGPAFQVPLSWQAAFACTLAVQSGGQVGFELAARCCDAGIRVGAITVALTALLDLGLCLVAVKLGSLLGIAVAMAAAYSVLTLSLGWYACRQMKASWWRLSLGNWLLALATVGIGVMTRIYLPIHSALSAALAVGAFLAIVLGMAAVLGIRVSDLREEARILRAMFGKR